LSFSSSGTSSKAAAKKRKAVGDAEHDVKDGSKQPAKKAKKAQKKLLSFGDDA
jgi:hypothetical protein